MAMLLTTVRAPNFFVTPRTSMAKAEVSMRSNAALFRRPDDLVLLNLEPHRQRVGNDFFGQFLARDGLVSGGNFFEHLALLFRRERMHPRKQQRTNGSQFMRGDLRLRPFVILPR